MLDESFIFDPIAARSMAPILAFVADALDALDADESSRRQIAEAVGAAYASGLTDGARHAIGEVAVEAERRGLRLTLGPELEAIVDGE